MLVEIIFSADLGGELVDPKRWVNSKYMDTCILYRERETG